MTSAPASPSRPLASAGCSARRSLGAAFRQNIPARLVSLVSPRFPGSAHVSTLGLSTASDRAIWDFAAANGFVIVSKDSDFHHMSFLYGPPPKAVWLRLGNCSTRQIVECLEGNSRTLRDFVLDSEAALLVLGRE